MNLEIGSYEAKTKFPELLRGVQAGNRYTITLRGEPVAALIPAEEKQNTDAVTAVKQMLAFMKSATPNAEVDIKALIGEANTAGVLIYNPDQ